ncbi:MAG: hypothetical protein COA96_13970 [SAR86 cluster bacterium]|uniref:Cytochrome c domain-containing protein n=1 Tax=SAR86 cluster bacterium TaxID=2030880 RepID=A0A2A5AU03_9GAMM|nr:MAG: hypothetical protein COA96_13970 [SAR86 cluster bacterium]
MSLIRIKSFLKIIFAFTAALLIITQSNSQNSEKQLDVTADLFKCLTEMARVGSGVFFVDNLLGDLDGTMSVANSDNGGVYPAGSVISLVPTEVMIKHNEGWNPETNDWEFIELNVSESGSEIVGRGTTDVINRFGGNCFDCHKLARPEWDLICGISHGCAPLPITREAIAGIQNSDPRCMRED